MAEFLFRVHRATMSGDTHTMQHHRGHKKTFNAWCTSLDSQGGLAGGKGT
jgi:hypothetical protein